MQIKQAKNYRGDTIWAIQFLSEQGAVLAKRKCDEAFGTTRIEHHSRSKRPWWIECKLYEVAKLIVEANKESI